MMDKRTVLDRLETIYRKIEEAKNVRNPWNKNELLEEASELIQWLMTDIR